MREHFNPWICILYIYMYVSRFMTYITIYVHRTCDSVMCDHIIQSMWWWIDHIQGRIQDFKVGGALKKKCAERREARKFLGYFVWKITILRQKIIFFPIVEGGAKIYGVFRVKNHDFTPTNHILSNFRGARAGCAPVPLDLPLLLSVWSKVVPRKSDAMLIYVSVCASLNNPG
jgi:hypothetical protein